MAVGLLFFIVFISLMLLIAIGGSEHELLTLCVLLIFLVGLVWMTLYLSSNDVVEKEYTTEIKTVVFPDGKFKQMFTINGKEYNANTIWGQVVNEQEYHVQVKEIKNYYYGLYDLSRKDLIKYNLVKK
jgi:hypothetical protein